MINDNKFLNKWYYNVSMFYFLAIDMCLLNVYCLHKCLFTSYSFNIGLFLTVDDRMRLWTR